MQLLHGPLPLSILQIFVSEPAIGEGLGATLIYFHPEDESENPRVATDQEIRYLIVS